jgi:hypothetical protein
MIAELQFVDTRDGAGSAGDAICSFSRKARRLRGRAPRRSKLVLCATPNDFREITLGRPAAGCTRGGLSTSVMAG